MKKESQFKPGDIVTVSFDRSSKIDTTAILKTRREDLEKEWEEFDGIEVEVWEDEEGQLYSRSEYQSSEAQFVYEPDFNE